MTQWNAVRQTSTLIATLALASQVFAQTFPTKPIRFVVGFPPGGATDQVTRAIAPKMGEFLGQPVLVENNGGASGMIASQLVARSAPDGHTILLNTTGGHLIRPFVDKSTTLDPLNDFTAITQLIESVFGIAANPVTGPKSLADMVDQAQFPTHYHNLETRCFWSSSLFHASLSCFAPCVTSRDLFSTTFGPAHR